MDPSKSDDWFDRVQYALAATISASILHAETIHKLADDPLVTKMVVDVGLTSIKIKAWAKKHA